MSGSNFLTPTMALVHHVSSAIDIVTIIEGTARSKKVKYIRSCGGRNAITLVHPHQKLVGVQA